MRLYFAVQACPVRVLPLIRSAVPFQHWESCPQRSKETRSGVEKTIIVPWNIPESRQSSCAKRQNWVFWPSDQRLRFDGTGREHERTIFRTRAVSNVQKYICNFDQRSRHVEWRIFTSMVGAEWSLDCYLHEWRTCGQTCQLHNRSVEVYQWWQLDR